MGSGCSRGVKVSNSSPQVGAAAPARELPRSSSRAERRGSDALPQDSAAAAQPGTAAAAAAAPDAKTNDTPSEGTLQQANKKERQAADSPKRDAEKRTSLDPGAAADRVRATSAGTRLGRAGIRSAQAMAERNLVCYLCGRNVAVVMVKEHFRECEVEETRKREALPEELRTPLPRRPDGAIPTHKDSSSIFLEYNSEARANYYASLPHCSKCRRPFPPENIMAHIEACEHTASPRSLLKLTAAVRAPAAPAEAEGAQQSSEDLREEKGTERPLDGTAPEAPAEPV
eukprot:m51a1_g12238 hypothetical protein (286) ;mRNA; r:100180-101166